MNEVPTTRASLLLRLREPTDVDAWNEFVEVYVPIIHQFARRRGLQDADSADVTQEVLRQVSRSMTYFDYNDQRGRFRNWLLTVTRSRIINHVQRRAVGAHGSGDTGAFDRLSDPSTDDAEIWNREHQQRLLAVAMQRAEGEFRRTTWDAFRLTSLEDRPASTVANELGMTTGAVYIAKSRVLARLREIVADLGEDADARSLFKSQTALATVE